MDTIENFSVEELMTAARTAALEKRMNDASLLLDQILERDPNHIRALDLYGFVRYFQKRYYVAEGYNREVLARLPGHAYALKGLGLCLARTQRLEEGLKLVREAITCKPTWADPYWDMAVVLNENERFEEAIEVLDEAIEKLTETARFESFKEKIKERMG